MWTCEEMKGDMDSVLRSIVTGLCDMGVEMIFDVSCQRFLMSLNKWLS